MNRLARSEPILESQRAYLRPLRIKQDTPGIARLLLNQPARFGATNGPMLQRLQEHPHAQMRGSVEVEPAWALRRLLGFGSAPNSTPNRVKYPKLGIFNSLAIKNRL